jgi:hypothetical protein
VQILAKVKPGFARGNARVILQNVNDKSLAARRKLLQNQNVKPGPGPVLSRSQTRRPSANNY